MSELAGKTALVVGVANPASIASGCAQAFHRGGARQILTCQNAKSEDYARPVAEAVQAEALLQLDVTSPTQLDSVFAEVQSRFGRLDILVHSIAFAPKADLQGGLINASAAGFAQAMTISCHSLIELARRARPLMAQGGSILTMSYYGSEKVIENYALMGPVKAALEASVRYLAAELGPEGIRVNALSPGPVPTRAASGLAHFDALMEDAAAKAPEHRLVTVNEIGDVACFLSSDRARAITGGVHYADAGASIMG
ncbi:MAG: enoyl-ACP reductase FabI [Pseudomonadota bacterium]